MITEEKKKIILQLIEKHPFNVRQCLNFYHPELFQEVISYQEEKIPFDKYGFQAKIYWYLNQLTEFSKCKHCGKLLTQTKKYKMLTGLKAKYCSPACRSANTIDMFENENKIERTIEEKIQILRELMEKSKGYIRSLKYNYPDIYSEVTSYCEDKIPLGKYDFSVKAYWYLNQLTDFPKCKGCGKDITTTKYYGLTGPKTEFCSRLCANNYNKKQISESEHIFFAKKYYENLTNNEFGTLLYDKEEFIQDVIKYHGIRNFISQKTDLKWKCHKCGRIVTTNLNLQYFHSTGRYFRCMNCYPFEYTYISQAEKDIVEFIKSFYNGDIITSSQSIIPPYQLDIYIPEKKLAIEFNGIYWHSEESGKDSAYHLMKTEMCEKQGIQLIHIFENEWINKQEIVKSRIKNLLGKYERTIYARKCEVKEISSKISSEFLNKNHIQGKSNAKVSLGLFYKDELISIMTFSKPRFNKKYEWELLRFSNLLGHHVIGGAGKLLKYFERKYSPKSLISYADRCWSVGKLYKAIGFNFKQKSEPNYFYIKNGTNEIVTRYEAQKHKLKSLLGESFDETLSENENMKKSNYYKIYNTGNLVFVKEY